MKATVKVAFNFEMEIDNIDLEIHDTIKKIHKHCIDEAIAVIDRYRRKRNIKVLTIDQVGMEMVTFKMPENVKDADMPDETIEELSGESIQYKESVL